MDMEVKLGPGEYLPDPTEGISRVEDLPPPQVLVIDRDHDRLPCPGCGQSVCRLRRQQRILHDLGDSLLALPRQLHVRFSQHRCKTCKLYFQSDTADLAPPRGRYSHRVMRLAVRLVAEDNLPYRQASWHLWRDHRVFVPFATIQNWVEAAGEKIPAAGRSTIRLRGAGKLQRLHRRR
jgi:hypothetical protein